VKTRIIAKLDVKPPHVVKPVHFEGLKKIGSPVELAQTYYMQEADELAYIDIVASLYQREILFDEIERVANQLYIPFSVGGGVKTIEDFSRLIHMGADKVILNTFALQENSKLIDNAARIFGSQAIVINIEAKKYHDKWLCYSDGGKIQSTQEPHKWAKEIEMRGAGEIILQSVDTDGMQKGFDIDLAKTVVSSVNIPVVIGSGAGTLDDIKTMIEIVKPSGVALASLLHYKKFSIKDIKNYLALHKVGGY
jgi:imidazole glycerol-phosphate synthase subunit HisF